MSVFARVHMPSLGGATEWLDSEPLDPAELRGRVVLVNFWTWTCINWLRQEPYVRAWSQAYRADGLVEHDLLAPDRPLAGEGPVVEGQALGERVGTAFVDLGGLR